jgi:hypothetical protein
MKSIFPALIYAAVAEAMIYRFALTEYSRAIDAVLTVVAIVGAIVLGIFTTRPFMAFCGATALAAPAISYSMLGYGLLAMAGFLHALSFGLIGAVVYKLSHGFRFISPTEKSVDDPL